MLLPPKRLESLLCQSIELQKSNCTYHNTTMDAELKSFSLLTDHQCERYVTYFDNWPLMETISPCLHKLRLIATWLKVLCHSYSWTHAAGVCESEFTLDTAHSHTLTSQCSASHHRAWKRHTECSHIICVGMFVYKWRIRCNQTNMLVSSGTQTVIS